jgi:hypothetical protein
MKKAKTQHLVFEADKPLLDAGNMRPEYDFSTLKQVGARGRFHKARREGHTTVVMRPDGTREITHYRPVPGSVVLDQDVLAYFPDSETVNAALRGLMALIPAKRRAARKRR